MNLIKFPDIFTYQLKQILLVGVVSFGFSQPMYAMEKQARPYVSDWRLRGNYTTNKQTRPKKATNPNMAEAQSPNDQPQDSQQPQDSVKKQPGVSNTARSNKQNMVMSYANQIKSYLLAPAKNLSEGFYERDKTKILKGLAGLTAEAMVIGLCAYKTNIFYLGNLLNKYWHKQEHDVNNGQSVPQTNDVQTLQDPAKNNDISHVANKLEDGALIEEIDNNKILNWKDVARHINYNIVPNTLILINLDGTIGVTAIIANDEQGEPIRVLIPLDNVAQTIQEWQKVGATVLAFTNRAYEGRPEHIAVKDSTEGDRTLLELQLAGLNYGEAVENLGLQNFDHAPGAGYHQGVIYAADTAKGPILQAFLAKNPHLNVARIIFVDSEKAQINSVKEFLQQAGRKYNSILLEFNIEEYMNRLLTLQAAGDNKANQETFFENLNINNKKQQKAMLQRAHTLGFHRNKLKQKYQQRKANAPLLPGAKGKGPMVAQTPAPAIPAPAIPVVDTPAQTVPAAPIDEDTHPVTTPAGNDPETPAAPQTIANGKNAMPPQPATAPIAPNTANNRPHHVVRAAGNTQANQAKPKLVKHEIQSLKAAIPFVGIGTHVFIDLDETNVQDSPNNTNPAAHNNTQFLDNMRKRGAIIVNLADLKDNKRNIARSADDEAGPANGHVGAGTADDEDIAGSPAADEAGPANGQDVAGAADTVNPFDKKAAAFEKFVRANLQRISKVILIYDNITNNNQHFINQAEAFLATLQIQSNLFHYTNNN